MRALLCAIPLWAALAGAGFAQSVVDPPQNPFLPATISTTTHWDPSQSDATRVPGPTGFARISRPDQWARVPSGFVNGGYFMPPPYPDGEQAVFVVDATRVQKLRVTGDRLERIAEWRIPGGAKMTDARLDAGIAAFDKAGRDDAKLTAYLRKHFPGYMERERMRGGAYPLVDRDGTLFFGAGDRILAVGDARPGDISSPLALRRQWKLADATMDHGGVRGTILNRVMNRRPPQDPNAPKRNLFERIADFFSLLRTLIAVAKDRPMGMNMLYDGKIVIASVGGRVSVIDRSFKGKPQTVSLEKGELVTNSFPVDDKGGIYVVSSKAMYKIVWTGERLSRDPKDGAWRAPYDSAGAAGGIRGGSLGSGSTPTLMGFGPDDDRLVVITDGARKMKVVAFWRDAIPADHRPIPGKAPQIAGEMETTMGQPTLMDIQSEQSTVVWGYGVVVVNNSAPPGSPPALLSPFDNVVVNGVSRPSAKGVEKFDWDPVANAWQRTWVRSDVAAPSIVPMVSGGSNQTYLNTVEDDGAWSMTGLDWATGETRTKLLLGASQVFNGAYTPVQILPDGDFFYGALAGYVRVTMKPEDWAAAPTAPISTK